MEFHLTYEGPLQATQKDPVNGQKDARTGHKHDIRRQLHPQLKQLWATNRFLKNQQISVSATADKAAARSPDGRAYFGSEEERAPMAEVLANRYAMFGYRFVPLVREDISVSCSIDILFLRRDAPGSVLRSGDIDNRLKTFFDALRLPKNTTELGGHASPADGEDPFFCLLEDDSLITRVSVETDTLLDPPEDQDVSKVRLVLTVNIRPYHVTNFNLNFA